MCFLQNILRDICVFTKCAYKYACVLIKYAYRLYISVFTRYAYRLYISVFTKLFSQKLNTCVLNTLVFGMPTTQYSNAILCVRDMIPESCIQYT